MEKLIEKIMKELNSRKFHSTEEVSDFFRKSLWEVADKTENETVSKLAGGLREAIKRNIK